MARPPASDPASSAPEPPYQPPTTVASWRDRLQNLWTQLTHQVSHWSPLSHTTQWFTVSETEVAEILASVRSQLPTTEAWLIGKPQSGKSSLIRGLTGVSASIVGAGFQPHTQHTERYTYPSADLPLLIFTDTVGLGDVAQDAAAIVAELTEDITDDRQRGRIFILTVKVTDFAIAQLRDIAQTLHQRYPDIPCLLVLTCLHELYPPEWSDHPPYPPTTPDLERAAAALQSAFQDIVDRTIWLDFTLETDGFTPVFYGLDALHAALADLLPQAEAQAIAQSLTQSPLGQTLSQRYREVGRRYISTFATLAAAIAMVPLPFATMPVLTTLQMSMVVALGQLYGQTITLSQAGGIVSAIAGGFLAQAIGRELLKFIPGLGSVVAASWAFAYTWALGEGSCVYFGDLLGGKTPDPQRIQTAMQAAFTQAQEHFTPGTSPAAAPPTGDRPTDAS